MIFDKTLLLSDQQAITADAVSTNTIDLGAAGTIYGGSGAMTRNVGKGLKIPLLIQVTETFATTVSLTINVQVDDNTGFGSPKQIGTTGAIPVADLVAGKIFNIDAIPRDADERYLRLQYDVSTDATAGKITAGIVMGVPSNG